MREMIDGRKSSLWTELKEGLRFVLGNPNLRAQAGCTATSNLFSSVAFSILLVFLVRELGLSAGVIGIVFSIGASRLDDRGVHGNAARSPLRHRPDDDRHVIALRAGDAARRLCTRRQRGDSFPHRRAARVLLHRRRLQHHPGELPAGDLPAASAGTNELGHALPGLGDHPHRNARRAEHSERGSAFARRSSSERSVAVSSFLWIVFSPQRHLREMPEPIDDEPSTTELGAALPGVADPLSPADSS